MIISAGILKVIIKEILKSFSKQSNSRGITRGILEQSSEKFLRESLLAILEESLNKFSQNSMKTGEIARGFFEGIRRKNPLDNPYKNYSSNPCWNSRRRIFGRISEEIFRGITTTSFWNFQFFQKSGFWYLALSFALNKIKLVFSCKKNGSEKCMLILNDMYDNHKTSHR